MPGHPRTWTRFWDSPTVVCALCGGFSVARGLFSCALSSSTCCPYICSPHQDPHTFVPISYSVPVDALNQGAVLAAERFGALPRPRNGGSLRNVGPPPVWTRNGSQHDFAHNKGGAIHDRRLLLPWFSLWPWAACANDLSDPVLLDHLGSKHAGHIKLSRCVLI